MRWGYGERPAQTLGWTEFWHAWVHHLFDERSRERSQQTWALYGSLLPHSKDQGTLWSELSQGQQREALVMLVVMYWDLPLSVRRLLRLPTRAELDAVGLHNVIPETGEVLEGMEVWERQAELTEGKPGSEAAHRFYQAAVRAAEAARAAREAEEREGDDAQPEEAEAPALTMHDLIKQGNPPG